MILKNVSYKFYTTLITTTIVFYKILNLIKLYIQKIKYAQLYAKIFDENINYNKIAAVALCKAIEKLRIRWIIS